MEITFLKDHLNNKKDDIINVSNKRAEYFIKTKVAKPIIEIDLEYKTIPYGGKVENPNNKKRGSKSKK